MNHLASNHRLQAICNLYYTILPLYDLLLSLKMTLQHVAGLDVCACLCYPLLLLIQVPLSCCTKLMPSVCFRIVILLRDLAVGCVYSSFPQQAPCCICPFMKLLLTSLLSLLQVFLNIGFSGTVHVSWCPQAQPPHLGGGTMHKGRGVWYCQE